MARYAGGGLSATPGGGFTGAPGSNPDLFAAAAAANGTPKWDGRRGQAWIWSHGHNNTMNTYGSPNHRAPDIHTETESAGSLPAACTPVEHMSYLAMDQFGYQREH